MDKLRPPRRQAEKLYRPSGQALPHKRLYHNPAWHTSRPAPSMQARGLSLRDVGVSSARLSRDRRGGEYVFEACLSMSSPPMPPAPGAIDQISRSLQRCISAWS